MRFLQLHLAATTVVAAVMSLVASISSLTCFDKNKEYMSQKQIKHKGFCISNGYERVNLTVYAAVASAF